VRPRGIVYVVTRSRPHVEEAVHSARSLRRWSPDLPATLFTDVALDAESARAFDRVETIFADEHPLKLKVRLLQASPYRQTLFLDSDTEIQRDVAPLFAALDAHDFAICCSPDVDMTAVDPAQPRPGKPGFFKGYVNPHIVNTGVFAYSDAGVVARLLARWYDVVRRQDDSVMRPGHQCDQTHFQALFRAFVAEQGLRVAILDNRVWNARSYLYPYLERDGLLDGIAIWHGRPPLSAKRASLAAPAKLG
jgi:hypothetical protein